MNWLQEIAYESFVYTCFYCHRAMHEHGTSYRVEHFHSDVLVCVCICIYIDQAMNLQYVCISYYMTYSQYVDAILTLLLHYYLWLQNEIYNYVGTFLLKHVSILLLLSMSDATSETL